MCESATCPHLGGDPDGLHDLFRRGARPRGGFGVPLDAVGALRHMGDGNRDQLLGAAGKRAVLEDSLAERLERGARIGRQVVTLVGEGPGRLRVKRVAHDADAPSTRGKRMLFSRWTFSIRSSASLAVPT